jgi:two-component system capsular synthesis sensor histidine kinase RcsC
MATPPPSIRALVVDDDHVNRMVITMEIEQVFKAEWNEAVRVTVDVADSGPQALELLSGIVYNVVLMDLMMPGMDGPMTISEMRKAGHRMPVIAVTAMDFDEAKRIVDSSVLAIVMKPIRNNELRSALMAALGL